MPSKLPVIELVRETYAHVGRNIVGFLLLLGAITVVATLALMLWPFLLMWAGTLYVGSAPPGRGVMFAAASFPLLTTLIVGVLGAVAWHRLILLNEPLTHNILPRGRETGIYLVRILAIYVPAIVVLVAVFQLAIGLAGGKPTALLIWIVAAAAGVALTRFTLAFPAAAIRDRKIGLLDSVMRTRGNTFRLFAAWLACALPVTLLGQLLDPSALFGVAPGPAFYAVKVSTLFAGVLLTATFASLAYGHFASRN
jgi:hypothetical protein